ncbi:DNA repair and recombination protein RadA [Candidatus Undinarchaeota archaeon]
MLDDITQLPGVGEQTAEKLKELGYDSIDVISTANADDMMEALGMSSDKVNKMIDAARNMFNVSFETAGELLERRKEILKLTTGSKKLDELLTGGMESKSITESYGAYGSGKSQLSMELAVTAQLPVDKGGMACKVVVIDSEGSFRPERVKQIAEAMGLDPEETLGNIAVARAYTSDEQMMIAEKVYNMAKEGNIKLVVVDSLTALFRSEYTGRGMLAERQQKLNRHLATLHKIADDFNAVVYVTNQVHSRPDMFFGDPTAPVGGHILGHAATFRLYLRKSKGGKRIARLVDAPHLPDGEAVFMVSEKGVHD